MNLDRNTIIGFVLLGILLIGYFAYTSKEQQAMSIERARQDSIELAKRPKQDTSRIIRDEARIDSQVKFEKAGQYKTAAEGREELFYVENKVLRIAFTNKGGQPRWVELKNFRNQDSNRVKLAGSDFDKIDYTINTGGRSAQITDFYFQSFQKSVNRDGDSVISFTLLSDSAGPSVTHQFVIRPDDYMIGFDIQFKGAEQLLTQGVLNLSWQYEAVQQESDLSFEKQNTQVGYVTDGEFDYHTIGRRSDKQFSNPVHWLGVRQRFFNTILVAKDNFNSGKIEWTIPPDSVHIVVKSTATMRMELKGGNDINVPFSIYYGPSNYKILKQYDMQMGKLVNLGQGMYAFVRPINKYVVIPVFDFIRNFAGSFGLAIALLTIFIRLLISPLTYSSYLSGAKMKVLRPEIAKLKEKTGGDQQQMSMEQMKLFREAGVNPLGGCIPALLQIPIFFALYSFFNASVDLRGQSFLWANDLSAYDKVIHFGTSIPLLGDHLSMFTITAVITSFLISLYSMSMTPDQSNPMLKYMPYIFPFFLLFIFNRLPSALTWYYTVSNLITLVIQFVIQNYIIDHDKILAKMDENRKKPKAKSKWQERMEQMQESQKKLKEMQQKGKR
ncbi:MAG: membrane protein insertase YidC [Terrimonas sp.]|nr:membrane protein insertase YidC [Terrimonas sp.]